MSILDNQYLPIFYITQINFCTGKILFEFDSKNKIFRYFKREKKLKI